MSEGFQFTPFGIQPLDATLQQLEGAIGAGVVEPNAFTPAVAAQRAEAATVVAAPAAVAPPRPQPSSPRQVIQAARARVKELRTELRRMKALQRELGELERLLKAAKQKPIPAVRSLRAG